MRNSLELMTYPINKNTKQDILETLVSISNVDADFTGRNGPEYLWTVAKEKDFKSNQDYLLDLVSKINNIEELVCKFMKCWLGHDGYYENYKYQIIYNKDNVPVAISLAYIH